MREELRNKIVQMRQDVGKMEFVIQPHSKCDFIKYMRVVSEFNDRYDKLIKEKSVMGELSTEDEVELIHTLICGSHGVEINFEKALIETNMLLRRVLDKKPTEYLDNSNEVHMSWLREYCVLQSLFGIVYAYKEEYVKSTYYLMLALKTGKTKFDIVTAYFVDHIIRKLPQYVSGKAKYTGCGFSEEAPMGSFGGRFLLPNWAPQIISAMEDKNGEVLVLAMLEGGAAGYFKRTGSVYSMSQSQMIDMYETCIIDQDYNVKK